MTRMTGPDCAVMCNLINTHTYTHTHTHTVKKGVIPHQSKRPGALKLAKTRKKQKTEQTPRDALFYFIEKRPGAFFFELFREEGPVGRAHDTRRCAKRTCC